MALRILTPCARQVREHSQVVQDALRHREPTHILTPAHPQEQQAL
jgi:hypothetical protein